MIFKPLGTTLAILGAALVVIVATNAQQGKWAASSDQTAKSLIDMERQWAEASCTHSMIVQDILADDFQGTSPDGKRYSKEQAVEEAKTSRDEARECRLNDAKVHFFGDNMALVYGNETAIRKASDRKERARSLIWTDTWLKRNAKWQIVAAQDMWTDCK
jgi:hypothetical protein